MQISAGENCWGSIEVNGALPITLVERQPLWEEENEISRAYQLRVLLGKLQEHVVGKLLINNK